MLETLAWERDIDLSGPKAMSASNQNLNLGSTQNTQDLTSPSPPPPQFVMGEYPTPSSIPQRITGDQQPARRTEFSQLRSRPSFIDYEDLEIFHNNRPLTVVQATPIRRTSMMPVDADGYKDLLLDFDHRHDQEHHPRKKHIPFISRGTSNTSIKSKITETSTC